MFTVASDYAELIELLVGAIVVSTYFGGRKHSCPKEISESLKIILSELWKRFSGHVPDPDSIRKRLEEEGDWDERSRNRINDAMLVMILYGAFSLFYCGNCYRLCSGKALYSITPYGIIIDSIFIFVYYIFLGFRYGRKYVLIDRIARLLKILFSIILLLLSLSYYKDFYIDDEQAHSLATGLILVVTCTLSVLVLLFFTIRNKAITRKTSKLVVKLSCIIDALDIIEKNADFSVVDKNKLVLKKTDNKEMDTYGRIKEKLKKAEYKKSDIYRGEYLIKLSFKLAINSIQYVMDISDKRNVHVYTLNENDEKGIESMIINRNIIKASYVIRFYEFLLHIVLKKQIMYNKALRKARKIPNNSQLKIEKNKVFDRYLRKVLNQTSRYGIPVNKRTE